MYILNIDVLVCKIPLQICVQEKPKHLVPLNSGRVANLINRT